MKSNQNVFRVRGTICIADGLLEHLKEAGQQYDPRNDELIIHSNVHGCTVGRFQDVSSDVADELQYQLDKIKQEHDTEVGGEQYWRGVRIGLETCLNLMNIVEPTCDNKDLKYAALIEEKVTIPGDERSKRCPGHGYPEHVRTFHTIKEFDSEAKMLEWVKERELNKYKQYKIIKFEEVQIETSFQVRIKT